MAASRIPANQKPLYTVEALYDYKTTNEGFLSLRTGDKVAVFKEDATGWLMGRNQRFEFGMFPGNYVRKESSASLASAADGSSSSSSSLLSGAMSPKKSKIIEPSRSYQEEQDRRKEFADSLGLSPDDVLDDDDDDDDDVLDDDDDDDDGDAEEDDDDDDNNDDNNDDDDDDNNNDDDDNDREGDEHSARNETSASNAYADSNKHQTKSMEHRNRRQPIKADFVEEQTTPSHSAAAANANANANANAVGQPQPHTATVHGDSSHKPASDLLPEVQKLREENGRLVSLEKELKHRATFMQQQLQNSARELIQAKSELKELDLEYQTVVEMAERGMMEDVVARSRSRVENEVRMLKASLAEKDEAVALLRQQQQDGLLDHQQQVSALQQQVHQLQQLQQQQLQQLQQQQQLQQLQQQQQQPTATDAPSKKSSGSAATATHASHSQGNKKTSATAAPSASSATAVPTRASQAAAFASTNTAPTVDANHPTVKNLLAEQQKSLGAEVNGLRAQVSSLQTQLKEKDNMQQQQQQQQQQQALQQQALQQLHQTQLQNLQQQLQQQQQQQQQQAAAATAVVVDERHPTVQKLLLEQSKQQKQRSSQALRSALQSLVSQSRSKSQMQSSAAVSVATDLREYSAYLKTVSQRISQTVDGRWTSLMVLYRKELAERRRLFNVIQELRGNIRVICRIRPDTVAVGSSVGHSGMVALVDDADADGNGSVIRCGGSFSNGGGNGSNGRETGPAVIFEFDKVLGPSSSQLQVYEQVKDLATSCMDGYNVCIFAYGQTGSGKTHTMEGTASDRGINYRIIEELFRVRQERQNQIHPHGHHHHHQHQQHQQHAASQGGGGGVNHGATAPIIQLEVAVVEIYNEVIYDLLSENKARREVRMAGKDGVEIVDLEKRACENAEQVLSVLQTGYANRAVGATNMNEHSSRSHCMLSVFVTVTHPWPAANAANAPSHGKKQAPALGQKRQGVGKLHLVDLAGSERLKKTEATGARLVEAQNINRSLSSLGDVVSALVNRQQQSSAASASALAAADGGIGHIPYRNSKLTMVLQDSLGGDAKTLMIVTVSGKEENLPETVASLQFAARVRNVENDAKRH